MMINLKHSPVATVLALGLWCVATIASAKHATSSCSAQSPTHWVGKNTRWAGDCQNGLAQGFGTLRLYNGSKPTTVFYGVFKGGEPILGVEEINSGFKAGRIDQGKFVKTDDRQTYIDAFKAAEKGALAAASQFKANGNQASSKFYQNKAAMLAAQMD